MTENESFCKNLSDLMERDNISGNKLAGILDVTPAAVSQYRNGRTTPSEENLQKLAGIFNCSTDYLLGRNENPSPIYNMQIACRMTGLTEDAINNISKYKNYYEKDFRTGEHTDYKGQLGNIISDNLSSLWLRPLLISIYKYKQCSENILERLASQEMTDGDPLQSVLDMQRNLSSSLSEVIYNFTSMIEDSCKTERLMSVLMKEEAKLRSNQIHDFDLNELLKALTAE